MIATSHQQGGQGSHRCGKTGCSKGKFTLWQASALEEFPEPKWIVEGIFPESGVVAVSGQSTSGKTHLCTDLAASVAAGIPWFGYPTVAKRVVYVVLEGKNGFRSRLHGWKVSHESPLPDNLHLVFDGFSLLEDADEFAEAVEACGGAGLIIIDTLNRASPGADENSSLDMGKIIAGATKLQEATGGLVVLIHHPGKDASKGLRGHSSLFAALDVHIEVVRNGSSRHWILRKAKDAEDGRTHAFELATVEVGVDKSGKPITTCYVVPKESGVVSVSPQEKLGVNQQIVLEAAIGLLLQNRLDRTVDPELPEGIPLEALIDAIKGSLLTVDTKRRGERTRQALGSLINRGDLLLSEGYVKFAEQ